MRQLVEQVGLADRITVASVGTGAWHIGERPHRGTQEILRRYSIPHDGCARQITRDDIATADYLVAMDRQNVTDVRSLASSGIPSGKLRRLLEYAPGGGPLDVPDPYFEDNFDEVYRLVDAGCRGLLARIRAEHNL